MKKIILITLLLAFSVVCFAQDAETQASPKYQEGVAVNTDKQEYKQGEAIKITVNNDLSESIFSHAGSYTPVFSIKYVEMKTQQGWKQLFAQCQYPHCIYEIDALVEIKAGQSVTFEWMPLIYINGTQKHIRAEPGEYRLVVYYQIRKSSVSEDWKLLTAYSNEFVIKK